MKGFGNGILPSSEAFLLIVTFAFLPSVCVSMRINTYFCVIVAIIYTYE